MMYQEQNDDCCSRRRSMSNSQMALVAGGLVGGMYALWVSEPPKSLTNRHKKSKKNVKRFMNATFESLTGYEVVKKIDLPKEDA